MKLEDYFTLKQLEEAYGIKPSTIRNYIMRDQVVPEGKAIKVGYQWFVEKNFAEEKWGNKMKKVPIYKIYQDSEDFKLKGFEYKEGMVIKYEGDSYPIEMGLFKTKEEALEELKKLKTKVQLWGDPRTVTVTEAYIEEQAGYFDEDGDFNFLLGGDILAFADLEDPAAVKEIEEKGRE